MKIFLLPLLSFFAFLIVFSTVAQAETFALPSGKLLVATLNHTTIVSSANDDFGQPVESAQAPETEEILGSTPALSPDRSQIAYDRAGLCVVDISGKNVRQLTDDIGGTSPSWSPDGKRLAYATQSRAIHLINVNGSGSRALTKNDGCTQPSWSSDGKWIAFIRDGKVAIMDVNGMNRRTIYSSSDARRPSLSADNRWILFAEGGHRRDEERIGGPDGERVRYYSEVFRVRTDTPKGARVFIEKVSPPETDCDNPCWSPDGKWIAFDGSKGGEGYKLSNLMVARADGSDFRQLTNSLFDLHYPSWR